MIDRSPRPQSLCGVGILRCRAKLLCVLGGHGRHHQERESYDTVTQWHRHPTSPCAHPPSHCHSQAQNVRPMQRASSKRLMISVTHSGHGRAQILSALAPRSSAPPFLTALLWPHGNAVPLTSQRHPKAMFQRSQKMHAQGKQPNPGQI